MARRRPRTHRRAKTEAIASPTHGAASPATAPASIAADGHGGRQPTKHRKWTSVRRRLLLRSKSAPADADHEGGTESIRSDDWSPATPLPSPPRPHAALGLREVGGDSGTHADNVDDGVPSASALTDLQRAVKLIEDERHLAAYELYLDARKRAEGCRRSQEEKEGGEGGNKQPQQQSPRGKRGRVWWKAPEGNGAGNNPDTAKEENEASDDERAWEFLQERREEFEALENRANLFNAAKENLSLDDDWIHAQTLFGVSTSYRREADGSLSVKIEGELHGVPLFEQLVVLRECDLYHAWAPFCSKSKKLAQLDKLDVVAWYIVGVPALGLTRDACYRAVGCDCMREDGSVLLAAVGLNDTEEYGVKDGLAGGGEDSGGGGTNQQTNAEPAEREALQQRMAVPMESNLVDTSNSSFLARDAILSTLEIPPIPSGMGRGRMTIRNFVASIDILAPTAARTKMVVNVDPNLPLIPQFMIDFCMKRMCGILLSRLQATARKVVKDPIKNAHARRMREDVLFYRDWLLPKFQLYCDELGWQMPKVGAFEIEEEDLEAEGMGWIDDVIEDDFHIATEQSRSEEDCSFSSCSSRARTRTLSVGSTTSSTFLKRLTRAKSDSREDKIAAARQRASKRLRPKPFSESKAQRLNELKVVKLRAEERIRDRRLQNSSEDSVASLLTLQTLQELDVEGEVTRYSVIFGAGFSFHAILVVLRRYLFLSVSERNTAAQDSLDFVLILLQAISLWALLNSSLLFAFERIDFGQQRLVGNMDHGKKLVALQIKRLSLLAAVSIAAVSSALGFTARSIASFCPTVESDSPPTSSHWWERLPRPDFLKRSVSLEGSADKANAFAQTIVNSVDVLRRSGTWLMVRLPFPVRRPIQKGLSFMSMAIETIARMPSTCWRVCESQVNASKQWGSTALSISTFVTLRLGVFVLALMLMGYLLLPKPERRADRRAQKKIDRRSKICSAVSSLGDSQGHSGVEGNLSSMEVIAEEDF